MFRNTRRPMNGFMGAREALETERILRDGIVRPHNQKEKPVTQWIPKPGDTVYTQECAEAEYIARVSGSHFVRIAYDEHDEGPTFGDPTAVGVVFQTPPTEKRHAEVVQLDARIRGMRAEIETLRTALRLDNEEFKKNQASIQEHEAVARIADFLQGKITHMVISPNYAHCCPVIQELAQAIKNGNDDDSPWDRTTKLVSLFGDSKGDLSWGINRYRDGSGSYTTAYPCMSLEDAKAVLRGVLCEKFIAIRNNQHQPGVLQGKVEAWMAAAASGDVEVPQDILEATAKQRVREADAALQSHEAKTKELLAKLERATHDALDLQSAKTVKQIQQVDL